jgi:hypothetical protein
MTLKQLTYVLFFVVLMSACVASPPSTPTSTAKLTITSTATPLPSPTPTLTIVALQACVPKATIRIRKGPGTEYEAIGGLTSGTCMTVLGRNDDSTWVYMLTEDNKSGWVAAWLLTVDGDLSKLSIQSSSETLRMAPTAKIAPTQTLLPTATKPVPTKKLPPTLTRTPFVYATSTPIQTELLCSQTDGHVGEYVTCRIERAYCDFRPDVNGGPTFCNDRPYPNQNFQLVIFGEDWSDYDGYCIMVSGNVSLYRGVPQIQGYSRSQVSYCQ